MRALFKVALEKSELKEENKKVQRSVKIVIEIQKYISPALMHDSFYIVRRGPTAEVAIPCLLLIQVIHKPQTV